MAIDNLNLNGITGVSGILKDIGTTKNVASGGESFGDMLSKAIGEVNDYQVESEDLNNMLAIGEVENLHDVSIAAQKAELTLNLAIEVRNKIVDAYKEIMRLQF